MCTRLCSTGNNYAIVVCRFQHGLLIWHYMMQTSCEVISTQKYWWHLWHMKQKYQILVTNSVFNCLVIYWPGKTRKIDKWKDIWPVYCIVNMVWGFIPTWQLLKNYLQLHSVSVTDFWIPIGWNQINAGFLLVQINILLEMFIFWHHLESLTFVSS